MPSFTVEADCEFDVYCECGAGLCLQSTTSDDSRGRRLTVEPCEKCLENSKSEGYDEGYEEARKEFEDE